MAGQHLRDPRNSGTSVARRGQEVGRDGNPPSVEDRAEGTADLYHAVPSYWGSKSRGILLFGSQPFGLRADEQVGWLTHGGGQALYDEMYGRFGLKPFLCGNSGVQWAGWFRNEINSMEDLQGLRYRTAGIASEMASRVGMSVEAMSGPEMFQALQSGTIDAGEFIGPWSDSALGYYQIAKNYYWPGVGEPSSAEECGINLEVYENLPEDLKQAVGWACESLYNPVWTEYTTNHAKALRQLVSDQGVQVRKLPDDVIVALGNAAGEVMSELREDSDELVRRIVESFIEYRGLIREYMTYADNGVMNARGLDYAYPEYDLPPAGAGRLPRASPAGPRMNRVIAGLNWINRAVDYPNVIVHKYACDGVYPDQPEFEALQHEPEANADPTPSKRR